MPVADPAENGTCPDCGTRLTLGVCSSCTLGALLEGSGSPPVAGSQADGALDVEFDRYRLRRRLASGGMGVVYEAEDARLKRTVALKMIRGSSFANEAEIARFRIEAEAAAALDHAHIVPIYEVGVEERDQPFFTMKLIGGESLAAKLKRAGGGGLGTEEVIRWLIPICRAVHHAHQRGVLHRDLKPGNILIDEGGKAWLTDFGLAKLAHEDRGLTRSSDSLGTPNYMAPELLDQSAGAVSTASDVWAVGVILWEALAGEPPFRGSSSVEIMRRIVEEEPVLPRGMTVDRDLFTLARRCLEKDPSRRLGSALEIAEELERWQRGEPLRVRRITSGERLLKWTRRNPSLAAFYVALAVGLVSTLVFWLKAEQAVDSLTGANRELEATLLEANATRLAADARLQVEDDPIRAILLAVEAVELSERRGGEVLPEAVESLLDTLQRVGGFDASPNGPPMKEIDDGYYFLGMSRDFPAMPSPDGRWLLTFDRLPEGVEAAIFDLHDPVPDGPVRRWKLWDAESGKASHFRAVEWLGDSSGVVAVDRHGDVRLWAGAGGRRTDTGIGSVKGEGETIVGLGLQAADRGGAMRGIAVCQSDDLGRISCRKFNIDVGGAAPILSAHEVQASAVGGGKPWTVRAGPDLGWAVVQHAGKVMLMQVDAGRESGFAGLATLTDQEAHWVTFSPSGNWLVFRNTGALVRLYDLRSGDPEQIVEGRQDLRPTDPNSHAFAFSPGEEMLAVSGDSELVELYSLHQGDGQPLHRLRAPGAKVNGLAFSHDGRWLAAGGSDRVVRVWPVGELEGSPLPREFRGMPTPVLDVTFVPGGKSLAACGMHPTYRQWRFDEIGAGGMPRPISRVTGEVHDLAISPDHSWVVMADSRGGKVSLSEITTGTTGVIATHEKGATGVAISPDGRWLASAGHGGMVKVWMLSELEQAVRTGRTPPDPVWVFDTSHRRVGFERRLAFHPRGELFCTSGDGVLFHWDLDLADPSAGVVEHPFHTGNYLLADVTISPDGRLMALARHGWDAHLKGEGASQYGNMVLLYDVSEPGTPVATSSLEANFKHWTNVVFSHDNRWLAAGSAGEGATVWDLHAGDIAASRRESNFHRQTMPGIAFSPDGRTLAIGREDGTLHFWDWRRPEATRSVATGKSIHSIGWLDEKRLITGDTEGAIIRDTDLTRLKAYGRATAGRELLKHERVRFHLDDR